MRTLPSSLLEKINQVNQTIYNNANPQMLIDVYKFGMSVSELDMWYVETIREKEGLGDIAFALKRTDPNKGPSDAYEIHVDNGIVKTATKSLKDFAKSKWHEAFTVGSGSAVAIEFDGSWVKDSESKYNLVTEDAPYLFWIDENNVLWRQKWDDITTKFPVAETVTSVKAIRGWKNTESEPIDQGLLCFYIKSDGNVYYRGYATQSDFTVIWESERQIAEFGSIESIGVFRTNDYRIGIIAEDATNLVLMLTQRCWSGMAIEPENVSVGLKDMAIAVYPIKYSNAFETENISAGLTDFYVGCAVPITPTITSITNSEDDTTHVTIKFSHSIYESLSNRQGAFTLKDSLGTEFAITGTVAGMDQTEMILTVANYGSAKNPMTLTYNNGITVDNLVPLLTTVKDNVHFAIESGDTQFTANIKPPVGYTAENVSIGFANYSLTVTQVYYKYGYETENISAGLAEYTITVTQVGSNPL